MANKQLLIDGAILVAGAGIGFGVGYLVFKKRFEKIAAQEIESVREAYAKNAQPKPDLSEVRRSSYEQPEEPLAVIVDGVIVEQQYGSGDETDADIFRRRHGRVPTTFELIQMGKGIDAEDIRDIADDASDANIREGNIFDNPEVVDVDPDTVGAEMEPPQRSVDRPYIISAPEWYANESDYDQITLTYWADDEVLADDTQRLIVDVDNVVGATALHRFGTLSDNPDIVYVRNDKLSADYEITKDERSYAVVVHGVDPDEYNTTGVPRRMRSNDD